MTEPPCFGRFLARIARIIAISSSSCISSSSSNSSSEDKHESSLDELIYKHEFVLVIYLQTSYFNYLQTKNLENNKHTLQVFCQTPCARGGSTTAKEGAGPRSAEVRRPPRKALDQGARRRNCAVRSRGGRRRNRIGVGGAAGQDRRGGELPSGTAGDAQGTSGGSAGGWSIRAPWSSAKMGTDSREYLFDRARWSGRPKFSARSTARASALTPFYRARSFSAAAGDAETGARAPYRRFLGRAAFLALLLEML